MDRGASTPLAPFQVELINVEVEQMTRKIENFGVKFISKTEAEIYYSLGDEEMEGIIIELDVDYQSYEPPEPTYPGCPEGAVLNQVFGLSVAERHAFDKWEQENDTEAVILTMIADKNESGVDGEVDYRLQQNKDAKAIDYAWGEACSQPEQIVNYESRRGE